MKLLEQLYCIHSASGAEKKMKKFIKSWVRENCPDAVITNDNKGNLYIVRGRSETYPCIVAHLDQVQDIHDKDFTVVTINDTIFAYSPSMRRVNGLGADDKNGIWIALKCLLAYSAIKIAFFVGEEVGCVGSSAANMEFFKDCRFIIEPDRRNNGDLITSISGMKICTDEFLNDIPYEEFGYSPTNGLMTDVETLLENGVGLACINMSCGYFSPHTDMESTSISGINNALAFVKRIIETCTKVYKNDAKPYRYGYGSYGYDSFDWEDYYNARYGSYSVKKVSGYPPVKTEDKESILPFEREFEGMPLSDFAGLDDWLYSVLWDNLLNGLAADEIWEYVREDVENNGQDYDYFLMMSDDVRSDLDYAGYIPHKYC